MKQEQYERIWAQASKTARMVETIADTLDATPLTDEEVAQVRDVDDPIERKLALITAHAARMREVCRR